MKATLKESEMEKTKWVQTDGEALVNVDCIEVISAVRENCKQETYWNGRFLFFATDIQIKLTYSYSVIFATIGGSKFTRTFDKKEDAEAFRAAFLDARNCYILLPKQSE